MRIIYYKIKLVLLGLLFMTACTKDGGKYKKVVSEVGFPADASSVDIPDNTNAFTYVELDISDINDAIAYDVFFRFEDPGVIGQQLRTAHGQYRHPVTNDLYYKIPVARGANKAAFVVIPNDRTTGDLTIKVILEEDLSGNGNYTLKPGKETFTLNYIDK